MNSTTEVSPPLVFTVLNLVEYCAVAILYSVASVFMLRILYSLYRRAERIRFQVILFWNYKLNFLSGKEWSLQFVDHKSALLDTFDGQCSAA